MLKSIGFMSRILGTHYLPDGGLLFLFLELFFKYQRFDKKDDV